MKTAKKVTAKPADNTLPVKREDDVAGANCSHLDHASEEKQKIPLAQIELSDVYKFRMQDDKNTVDLYAEIFQRYIDDKAANEETVQYPFEAIHVLRQENGTYIVIAGRHRFKAAQKVGVEEIECIILEDRKGAIQIGLESNRHGLPLNHDDKTHCIKIAVTEFPLLSNRRIANLIGCSSRHVDHVVDANKLRTGTQQVEGKDGKMHPSNKREKNKPIQPQGGTAKASDTLLPERNTQPVSNPQPQGNEESGVVAEPVDDEKQEGNEAPKSGTEPKVDVESKDTAESECGEEPKDEEKPENNEKSANVEKPEDTAEPKADMERVEKETGTSGVPSIPIDRIVNELRTSLELPEEDNQRAESLVVVIKTIFDECFTTVEYRRRFRERLQQPLRSWSDMGSIAPTVMDANDGVTKSK